MDIAVQPQGKVHARGRRRRLVIALGVPIALVAVAWATLGWLERSGRAFYETGSAVVGALAGLAGELKAGDLAAAERRFAGSYRGAPLGLLSLRLVEERDGVRVLELAPPAGDALALDRAAALDEWRRYLAGFSTIEELGLYVHRVEAWDAGGDVTAVARLELIGTPMGAPRSVIDRAFVHMVFDNGPGGPEIREARLVSGDRVAADRPQFVDVGVAAGIAFENRYYPRFLDHDLAFGMIRYGPGGITAADYDNDGFYDLFVPDGVESKLLRNSSDGTFADVTAAAGLAVLDGGSVALFADYDNDGHKDLFVWRTFEPNQLFHNDGDGTFTNVTAGSGLGADCCTTVASWADYDDDGDLDLYVGRYLDPRTAIPTTFYARNGLPNQLYRNDGDGRFTNVTDAAGVGEPGLCLGTVFGDYDDDGDADLYVVNDFGRSTLYRNEGDGTFADVTVEAGTLAYGAGMNASMADYDNDGRLDLYTTDIRSEHGWYAEAPTVWRYMANSWRQGVWSTDMPLYFEIFRQSGLDFIDVFQEMASGNHLLRNKGDGTFEDVTWQAEANPLGWFWGAVFADFDNDGWQDIYAADGWVYNDPGTEIELEFLNNVVSRQDEYKSGTFFDPAHFGTRSWHGWERNRHLRNKGAGAAGRRSSARSAAAPAPT